MFFHYDRVHLDPKYLTFEEKTRAMGAFLNVLREKSDFSWLKDEWRVCKFLINFNI